MPICLPCRSGNHPLCLTHGCVCQHKQPLDPPAPTGQGVTTTESESR